MLLTRKSGFVHLEREFWYSLIVVTRRAKGKLEPKWEGPYVIEKVYSNGAYLLIMMDGDRIIPPTNARFLKKYYP